MPSPRPTASNLNFTAGSPPTPNQVTVGLSATGAIGVYNLSGTVDIIVDIVGYYQAAATGGGGGGGGGSQSLRVTGIGFAPGAPQVTTCRSTTRAWPQRAPAASTRRSSCQMERPSRCSPQRCRISLRPLERTWRWSQYRSMAPRTCPWCSSPRRTVRRPETSVGKQRDHATGHQQQDVRVQPRVLRGTQRQPRQCRS